MMTGPLHEELATLRSRLGSDPTRSATVRRRLAEVETALGLTPGEGATAGAAPTPDNAAADHSDVRKATRPPAQPRPAAAGNKK